MNTLACLAALLAAIPAAAGVSAGVGQTFGTAGYRSTAIKAALDLGESAYVAPRFSSYRSDSSGGVYRTFGLRLGYETGPMSLGAEGSLQPKTNGYKKSSFGLDATFTLTPGGSKHGHRMAGPSSGGEETFGSGLAAVDVGAALTGIRHEDDFTGSAGSRRPGAARASALLIRQTDVSVFAGLRFLIAELSAELTKSRYDRNISAAGVREAQLLALNGFDSVVQGFPDTSVNVRLKWKTLPLLKPSLSYTRTTFKLGAAPSHGYEAGVTAGLNMISLKAAYERYVQGGFADQSYYTVGASLNF